MRIITILTILLILEFLIHDTFAQENIALGKQVKMSSIDGGHEGYYAVDGVDTIDFKAATGWLRTFKGQFQWVQIDLGAQYELDQIRLSKRGLRKIYVPAAIANDNLLLVIGDDPDFKNIYNPNECGNYGFAIKPLNTYQDVGITPLPKGFVGRYLRIWDANHGGITLAEIEVKGKLSQAAAKIAMQSGDVNKAKEILEKQASTGENVNQDENLRLAIDQRKPELVQSVLSSGNQYVSASTFEYALGSNYNSRLVQQLLSSGEVEISSRAASLAIQKKDPALINKMLNEQASSFRSKHVDEAMTTGSPEIAKAIMLKSKISPSSTAMNAAINSGNMLLVSDMINKFGASPTSPMLTSAIRTQNQSLIHLLLPKVKPNSDAYVLAVQQNDAELYTSLVESKGLTDNRSIELAINKGNMKILKSGLSNGGKVNDALNYAISKNKADMVSYILTRKGANANQAISYAVTQKNAALFSSILNEHNGDADKALAAAIQAQNNELAIIALETGRPNGTKYLKSAVENNHTQLAKKIVEFGGDPDEGMQAAIERNNPSLVEYFISFGASVAKPEYMAMAGTKSLAITRFLVEKGAHADEGIASASGAGKVDIVNYLLENAANPSRGIQAASLSGQDAVLGLLLENGGDPKLGILEAVKGNHTSTVNLLLNGGAPAQDPQLIAIASGKNNERIASALVQHGANPDNGLSAAVHYNADKALKELIKNKANAKHDELVERAVQQSSYLVIPILALVGNDMDKTQADGSSYLHMNLASGNNLNTIMALLEAGVSPNLQDNQGNTALHQAARKGKEYIPIIQALANKGADVNALNHANQSPRKVAKGSKTKNAIKKLGGTK